MRTICLWATMSLLLAAAPATAATCTRERTVTDAPRATIARIWKGRTPRAKADQYQRYWLSQLPPLREKAQGLDIFRRDDGDTVEFTSISYWRDEASMLRFSKSDDPTAVHHLPRDAEFLIELPKRVEVVQVLPDSSPHC